MEPVGTCPCGRSFIPEAMYGYIYFHFHSECVKAGLWPLVRVYKFEANTLSNSAHTTPSEHTGLNDMPQVPGINLLSLVNMTFLEWKSLVKSQPNWEQNSRVILPRPRDLKRFAEKSKGRSLLEAPHEPPTGPAALREARSQDMATIGSFTEEPSAIAKERLKGLRLTEPATDAVIESPHPDKLPEATTARSDDQNPESDPGEGTLWYLRQDTTPEPNPLLLRQSKFRKLREAETPFSNLCFPDNKSLSASRNADALTGNPESKAPKGNDWYESWKRMYQDQESTAEMRALESCKATAISCFEAVFAPEPQVSSASESASGTADAAHSRASGASRGSTRMGYRYRSRYGSRYK